MFRTVDCNENECQASEGFELETFEKEAIIFFFHHPLELSVRTSVKGHCRHVTHGHLVMGKKTKRYREQEAATTKILCIIAHKR